MKYNESFWIIALFVILLIIAFFQSNWQKSLPRTPNLHERAVVPTAAPLMDERAKGQIIVRFKDGVTDEEIASRLKPLGGSIKGKIPEINGTVVNVPIGYEDVVRLELGRDPLVKYAEPDYIQHVFLTPNDQLFTNQWGLANSGQTIQGKTGVAKDDINIEPAWNVSQGNGVKVAVIDTGVDLSHPDLASKVALQKILTTATIDDKFGHGTHVAGIIAADTNNSQGVAGVCPGCQLLVVKAMNDAGLGLTSDLATAVIWAADNGAKVINLSEGGGQLSQAQSDAVTYAWNKGAVIVGAAGNADVNQQFFPAAFPQVVSVAATDNSDTKASFSNFGSWVKVAAPGESIFSTLPTHAFGMQSKAPLNLNYDYLSGTSMAAPIVSGVVALLWTSPFGTSNSSVVARLLATSDKITGTGQFWQSGRINAAKALGITQAAIPTISPTSPTSIGPITPTLFCLGSCPTLPLTPGVSVIPTSIQPSQVIQPSSSASSPTVSQPSVSPNPCSGTIQAVTAFSKRSRLHKGRPIQGLLRNILQLLLDLIRQLLNLIRIILHLPVQPVQPVPQPSPAPAPCPSVPVQPTGAFIPPTANPTTLPSSSLPTASQSPVTGMPSVTAALSPIAATGPLPGQKIWKNGISSFLFGTNDTIRWSQLNAGNDPAIPQALFTAHFQLLRTWFFANQNGSDFTNRMQVVAASGAQPLCVLPDWQNASYNQQVVSTLGNKCNIYEFGNEPDSNMTVYIQAWNAQIPQLRKLNPNAKFIGPVAANHNNVQVFVNAVKSSGVIPDAISFHRYPCSGFGSASTCLSKVSSDLTGVINLVRGWTTSALGANIPIGITEWNYDSANPAASWGQNSQFIDQFTTIAINTFIQDHLDFSNQFDLANDAGQGTLDMFDVMHNNGQPKQQFTTMANLILQYFQ